MFEYLKGKLTYLSPETFTIEINGIGYKLFVPINLYTKGYFEGDEVTFYTSLVVREDSHKLFGFAARADRELFERLLAISGIGVKTAINLIGHMTANELKLAVQTANIPMLSRIPGIGKKTAERIIVELSDRIHKWKGVSNTDQIMHHDILFDAISALMNLGYNESMAQKAIQKVVEGRDKDPPKLPELITSALKHL